LNIFYTGSAVISAYNESDYEFVSSSSPNLILMGIILLALTIGVYFLNKKFNFYNSLKNYLCVLLQDNCNYCERVLRREEGVRETVNFEGTLLKRKLAFCDVNHMNAYLEKWGEPLGCADCLNFEKFSFGWWVQWSKLIIIVIFLILIGIMNLFK
jgi:hypothetical protein